MRLIILFLLFWTTNIHGQLNPKSISYEYFYKNELDKIVKLKIESEKLPNNIKFKFALAQLYNNINIDDLAYDQYYQIFLINKKKAVLSKEQNKELLFQLHLLSSSKFGYEKDQRDFLNLLKQYSNQDQNDQWKAIIDNELAKDYLLDSSQTQKAFLYFLKAQNTDYYKSNPVFKHKILINLGYLFIELEDFKQSEKLLLEAISDTKKTKDSLNLVYADINLALNFSTQKKYDLALKYLDSAEYNIIQKYKPKILRLIYFHKKNIYQAQNNQSGFKKSNLIYSKLDSLINDFKKNIAFYEIDLKYQVEEKNNQISSQNSLIKMYNKSKYLYLTLIALVFLLALYSFVRWKKSDYIKNKAIKEKQNSEKRNIQITEDHLAALQELENIKQLVIEDHIILKNKSKVFLNDLVYIKSEDHYLQIYTKDHQVFLRGSINEILKQLPPNFKQIHRSFIINTNFIQSQQSNAIILKGNVFVPLSRKYKHFNL